MYPFHSIVIKNIQRTQAYFFGFIIYGITMSCQAQSATNISPHATLGNNYVDSLRAEKRTPGMSAAIAHNGDIIWEYGSGMSHIEKEEKACPNTVYRIASVSKLITTAAIASLVQQGKLKFSDNVNKYFKISDQKVSIAQVLSHTSGIRHYNYNEKIENYPYYNSVVDALEVFINDPLDFTPGEQHQYSSYGIDLLGAIVEKASGLSFENYVKENILKPLQMQQTFLRTPRDTYATLAGFYMANQSPVPDVDLSYNIPGGGMYSTVQDLVIFGSAFLSDDFLNAEIRKNMFTNAKLNDGTEIEYCLGWIVQKLVDGSNVYYHDGHMDGTHSILVIYPRHKLSISLIANKGSNWGVQEALELACRVAGIEKCPEIVAASQMDPQEIRQLFQKLSSGFEDFREAISSKNTIALNTMIASNFKSDHWPDKSAFIDFLIQVGDRIEVFDVDISVRGFDNGDKTYIKTLLFPGRHEDKSWYLIYTLKDSQWLITSVDIYE